MIYLPRGVQQIIANYAMPSIYGSLHINHVVEYIFATKNPGWSEKCDLHGIIYRNDGCVVIHRGYRLRKYYMRGGIISKARKYKGTESHQKHILYKNNPTFNQARVYHISHILKMLLGHDDMVEPTTGALTTRAKQVYIFECVKPYILCRGVCLMLSRGISC